MNLLKKHMNTLNATFINFFNKVTKTRFGSSHGSFSSCLSCLTNNPNGHQTTNCPKYGDIELNVPSRVDPTKLTIVG
jgi:hypothetical protein